MKHTLVLVPIVFLVLLNACATAASASGNVPTATIDWTAYSVAATLTNMPPPPPTPAPDGQWLITSLNAVGSDYAGSKNWEQRGGVANDSGLSANLDQLEDSIGADFIITGVDFPYLADKASMAFRIRARCECAISSSCCTPEHMFVLTIRRLYLAMQSFQPYQEYSYLNRGQVPAPIQQLQVDCYDRNEKMATMVAPWADVLSFMQGQINGYQLGQKVYRQ